MMKNFKNYCLLGTACFLVLLGTLVMNDQRVGHAQETVSVCVEKNCPVSTLNANDRNGFHNEVSFSSRCRTT